MAENTGDRALRALVRLEIDRILPVAGRSLVMGAVVAGVIAVSGAFTLPRLAFILALVGTVPAASIPVNALRDKLDGGLEFLQLLPVSPGTQAMARLVALAFVALPGALLCAGAAALSLRGDIPGVLEVRSLAGIAVAVELTQVMVWFLGTALVLRFQVQQGSYVPLALVGLVAVLGQVAERYLPDPVATFTGLMVHPWFPPALWTAGLVVTAATGWFAFTLASTGIARFSPGKDRITW